MSGDDSEFFKDIEDLISSQDITPKDRYANKKDVNLRARKIKKIKVEEEDLELPIISGRMEQGMVDPAKKTIYLKTWGCAHNNSDSEYMAGQLAAFGYHLTDKKELADLWLLNSCTVKNPAEDTFRNDIQSANLAGKHIVLAGCVPQGAPKQDYMKGLSMIGVQQIDRVVEVVEESLKGHTVRLMQQRKQNGKKVNVSLDLPKVRKNPLIEIIPINSGCLNQCTYCKTKSARGDLASYTTEQIVNRAQTAFKEGVCEIWLTSEDTGAYGRDIGSSLPELLWQLVDVIPAGCMLRVGMTNPPYILEHLDEIAKVLKHPKVYAFLHVPVQSGSDSVLGDMKREYCCEDFERVVDFLREQVPGVNIATDIICGFPTETEADFKMTLKLCEKYKFTSLFINQFFPRPGTPASLMPRIPANLVKLRTKELTDLFYTYAPYTKKVGMTFDSVLVTEISSDKKYYVGHNKFYEQILLPMKENLLGKSVSVKIKQSTKFSMFGEIIEQESEWKQVNVNQVQYTNEMISNGFIHNSDVDTNGEASNDKDCVSSTVQSNDKLYIYGLVFLFMTFVYKFVWNLLKDHQ